MEAPVAQQWFLRKHADGSTFGPVSFAQLARWAAEAQVAPHDSLSSDGVTWMKAPMLPELQMDWIVEVTSERYYGPTTLGALGEFARLEEINDETFVINACDGTRQQLRDIAPLIMAPAVEDAGALGASAPAASGMSIRAEERIRELEHALREERRALAELEQQYRALEQKYAELLAAEPAV